MSEINKRIEALEAELQKLKNEVKPKFEVGKWYKLKESTGNAIACYQGIKSGFGISGEMWFNNDNWTFPDEPENWIPATHQEVEEALIKEAKKRGFKEGVRIKWHGVLDGWDKHQSLLIGGDYYKLYANERQLSLGMTCIFCDGKWAEIVKDEPIMINGYQVEKVDNHFKIGCKQITRKELNHIKGFMERNNYVNVKFSSENNAHLVDLETINKILAL